MELPWWSQANKHTNIHPLLLWGWWKQFKCMTMKVLGMNNYQKKLASIYFWEIVTKLKIVKCIFTWWHLCYHKNCTFENFQNLWKILILQRILNPQEYDTYGYTVPKDLQRLTFLYKVGFWENWMQTLRSYGSLAKCVKGSEFFDRVSPFSVFCWPVRFWQMYRFLECHVWHGTHATDECWKLRTLILRDSKIPEFEKRILWRNNNFLNLFLNQMGCFIALIDNIR